VKQSSMSGGKGNSYGLPLCKQEKGRGADFEGFDDNAVGAVWGGLANDDAVSTARASARRPDNDIARSVWCNHLRAHISVPAQVSC